MSARKATGKAKKTKEKTAPVIEISGDTPPAEVVAKVKAARKSRGPAKPKSPKTENAPKASKKAKEGRKPKTAQASARSRTKSQTAASDTPDEAETRGRGRPTDYRQEYAAQAQELFARGATLQEAAEHFGVAVSTIKLWRVLHDDFSAAVKAGKEVADDRVEMSLYERAVGYAHEAVKIFMPAGAEKPVYAPYIERFPPDPGACLNWLKNRRPDKWRDKTDLNVSMSFREHIIAAVARRNARTAE
jgi:hypothetical protein